VDIWIIDMFIAALIQVSDLSTWLSRRIDSSHLKLNLECAAIKTGRKNPKVFKDSWKLVEDSIIEAARPI